MQIRPFRVLVALYQIEKKEKIKVAIVKPFHALRPAPSEAAAVASVPYDVVNTEEARALAGENPLSFLRVSRPEIELPTGTSPYGDEVYALAKTNFERLIAAAPLQQEPVASFYLYRLRMGDREQTGLVACCSVAEYDEGIICRHERTRRDKEDDRTRHILTLRAQTGPVFLTYRPHRVVDELVAGLQTREPLFDVTAVDGVVHTVWQVPSQLNGVIEELFGEIPRFYIADGHHRAKSASRACEELLRETPTLPADAPCRYFQCVLFPADQLRILAYNRVVRDLAGMEPDQFLERVAETFEVKPEATPVPPGRGHFSVYLKGHWYGLQARIEMTTRPRAIDRLDVSLLQDLLLAPLLGIEDPRTDQRIDFVGGIRGTDELERLVDEGRAAIAFSLSPVSLEELMEISDADEIMPPKSTWFEPKLRDGLLSHLI
jgi:uncharacterized protein (DUF1015 family)